MENFSALDELIKQGIALLPGLIGAFVILIGGMYVAKLVAKLTQRFLKKAQVDKLADKLQNIDLIEKMDVEIKPSAFISKILYYFLVLIVAATATDVLGVEFITDLIADLVAFVPQLIVAILIMLGGLFLADFLRKTLSSTCKSLGIPSADVIANFVFYLLLINIAIVALEKVGVDTDFIKKNIFIILGGIVLAFSVGYGFASRNILSSLLTTFHVKTKFTIGDKVKIGEHIGEVMDMDSTSLTLKTEQSKIVIPLHALSNDTIEIMD